MVSMAQQETPQPKKPGLLPTGIGTPIQVRLQPAQLDSLDAWIAHQPDSLTRPEAVRRLLDKVLSVK